MKVEALYSKNPIGLGKQPHDYPNQFVEGSNLAAGEVIPFGRAVGQHSIVDGIAILKLSSVSLPKVFRGVSVYSTDAKDQQGRSYVEGDPLGIVKSGVITVYCEEIANPNDPVRIRIQNHSTDLTKRCGNFCKTAITGQTVVLEGAEYKSESSTDGKIILFLSDYVRVIPD
ncbi:hypothetical protein LEP1GSC188_3389 [Leptospira weilii serovar Topaz str. LT2116]|uniref:Uncharacterized protein n=1 Tax=Leptospira weilii serovar Topaz str. LT2116 TaxID=1088540 RepID=M3GZ26_9LEPT|nr:hypothetical protein LEP1GSC188_3389 [Leptospira weilii serovar Topaz str. LT2116]